MTLIEAMCHFTPAVVTDVGGNAELVSDGENGFVVPSDDENAFATAALRLAQDSSQRRKFARMSRSLFEQKFGLEQMVNQFSAVYLSP